MEQNELHKATQGVALALTKFAQVVQDLNDSLIQTNNATNAPSANVAPIIPTAPQVPQASTAPQTQEVPAEPIVGLENAPLDGEGRPWIDGLHTANKSQMNSTEKRGVKAWKFLRGTSDEAKQEYRDKYPMSDGEVNEESTTVAPPVLTPGAPPAPTTPGGPPALGAPPAPTTDNANLRAEILTVCKSLIDVHNVSWDDLKSIFADEFKAAQNGEQVTLGSLKDSEYANVLSYLRAVEENYAQAQDIINKLYVLATPTYKTNVDDGLAHIFGSLKTTELSGVYYSDLDECLEKLEQMFDVWSKWASGN